MDGVYATHPKQGRGMHFVRVPTPSTEEVGFLAAKIARKSERWLSKQGYESNEDWDVDVCDALPLFQEASVAGRTATGARRGMKIRRIQRFAGREFQLPKRCASVGGYNLHGGVQVSAKNRKGLEKLCRYIARPPLAKSRLLEDIAGEYRILLKTPWSDGTNSIQVGLLELMVTERSGVGESPNEERAKRVKRLEPYVGLWRLFRNHVPINFCIMVFLRITPSIARRFCRSIEEYEQNRSGRSCRGRMGAIADMLHGHNCCGEVLV